MTTKRKKFYAILLTLGCIAFVLDCVVLNTSISSPESAVASSRANPDASQQPSVSPDNVSISIPEIPFPKNLPPYDSKYTLHDIFAPPTTRSKTITLQDEANNGHSDMNNNRRLNRSDIFLSQHQLNASLNGPRLKIAVVDGQWIRIGDTLDGCILRKIEGTSAIFSCSDGNAILNLAITDVTLPD